MKQLNHIRACATPGFKGQLIPVHVTIRYACNGRVGQAAVLENVV